MNNSIKRKLIGSLIVTLLAAGIILFAWYETSTQQNVAQSDLSKIKMFPGEGDHILNKILLVNYSLNYATLKSEDICLSDSANPGDSGIVIRGTLKNEYNRDYYIMLEATAYDSGDKRLGGSTDSGPTCGMIVRDIKSNMTEDFELHLKYNKTISRIRITGLLSDIPPP